MKVCIAGIVRRKGVRTVTESEFKKFAATRPSNSGSYNRREKKSR